MRFFSTMVSLTSLSSIAFAAALPLNSRHSVVVPDARSAYEKGAMEIAEREVIVPGARSAYEKGGMEIAE